MGDTDPQLNIYSSGSTTPYISITTGDSTDPYASQPWSRITTTPTTTAGSTTTGYWPLSETLTPNLRYVTEDGELVLELSTQVVPRSGDDVLYQGTRYMVTRVTTDIETEITTVELQKLTHS